MKHLFVGFTLAAIAISFLQATPAWAQGRRRSQLQVSHTDAELQLDDEVKVRQKNPPPKFDDKGKPAKYTSKELRELKGADLKLPGYTADYSDLKPGQIVTVYLSRKKTPKSADRPAVGDNNGKAEKPHWTPVGQLTGHVTQIGDRKTASTKSKKTEGGVKRLTLRVDSVGLRIPGASARNQAAGPDDDVFVTVVLIDADTPAGK